MGDEIAAESARAEAGEDVLTTEMTKAQRLMEERIATDPGASLGDEANDTDVSFLVRPETILAFQRIIPEQAVNGVGGSVDYKTPRFVYGLGIQPLLDPGAGCSSPTAMTTPRSPCRTVIPWRRPCRMRWCIQYDQKGHFADDPIQDILETHRWLSTGQPPRAAAPITRG